MKLNEYSPLNINYNRLLAKHELGKELRHTSLREKLSDNNMYNRKKNVAENVSKYSQIKGIESNNLNAYMNGYKKRYSKRKGLSKMDCYCEQKIFKSIDKIHKHIDNMNSTKGILKKVIYNKYGLRILLLLLFPLIGIIIRVLDEFGIGKKIETCTVSEHSGKECYDSILNKIEQVVPLTYIYIALCCIYIIIVFSAGIYILKKIIKYNNLKEGTSKM
ncbi:unnamed protein product [Plasmodium vivax]|uniref:(malaria parasite P. vivax) hypothetical protein n=2 Tax=Plasmodium vivax TaxID=5855 RepID=A0A8S4H758_PLAVI|nr:unnamed protein product [Plasmodium vivax]